MAWLYKRGGVWWVGWRHEGKLFARSTKQVNKAEAEKEKLKFDTMVLAHRTDALTDEFYRQLTGRAPERVLAKDYFQKWLAEAIKANSKRTVDKYTQVVREFLEFTKAESTALLLEQITPEHVRDFLLHRSETIRNSTLKIFRRVLRSVFLQAMDEGRVTRNPVPAGRAKKNKVGISDSTPRRPFTSTEIQTLYALATPFWQYMILGGYHTGLRMGDLICAKVSHFDLHSQTLTLVPSKTDRKLTIPLHRQFLRLLLTLPKRKASDYVWPEQAARYQKSAATSFSQEFYSLMTEAQLVPSRDPKKKNGAKGRANRREQCPLGFHSLRHNFVTALKEHGAMDSVAKELAGHRSNIISQQYTHLPLETLRNAINNVPDVTGQIAMSESPEGSLVDRSETGMEARS